MAHRIEREIPLPASPRRVWQAITDAGALEGWLAEEVRLELTPGGEARFREGESVRSGWVEEVLAPDGDAAVGQVAGRLVFWWSQDEEPASRVELTLIALASGTRLRVVETRPLEVIDLVGIPLPGVGGQTFGPALVAAGR
ncbi:MAG: SRPBCC domain-containing protein [Actinomycetota bacterium]|nr:SRPBCC domain-containing protein [Actinomycetota bacterium]